MNLQHKPATVVSSLRIAQVPVPVYPSYEKIPIGSVLLSGDLVAAMDRYKLDTADMPPTRFKSVRDDIARYSPIPVTRVAMRYAAEHHAYVGIIDSNDEPYIFALNSRGMRLRKAPDTDGTWQLFDQYMTQERAEALQAKRKASDGVTYLNKSVKAPGSRGGHYYFDKHGQVRYGAQPQPKSKHAVVTDHEVHVHLPKVKLEGAAAKLHKHVRKQAPATVHETRRHVRSWIKENFDVDDTKHLDRVTSDMLRYFHDEGGLHLQDKPQHLHSEHAVTFFKKRQPLAKPVLPKAFDAQGTRLIVNGKPVRVSADAEHACYAYAKRFIVNEGKVKNQAAFMKGFEQSLQKMGVPAGKYDFKNFVARVNAAPEAEKLPKSKEAPTPKTHPHMFIKQDGQFVRLSDVRTPPGNFYTGKGKLGAWARALREEDLTMNVSHGAAPAGWKGKIIDDPSKDYYLTWRHPDTDELGYVYPSRANAYQKKFEEAEALGKAIEDMRPKFVQDIEHGKNAERRVAALCAYLMDKEHFRVGEEAHAEETGTFGVGSFRVEHVQIDGKHVIFDFPGKKDEPWRRVVDFSQLPEALALIKSCVKGKHKKDKLWEGDGWSVNSKSINAYLDGFSQNGVKFTAKMFRTYHANKYMKKMLTGVERLGEFFDWDNATMKKMYKGFDAKDKAGQKLLNTKFPPTGQTVREYLGLMENYGAKGKGKVIIGVLPTIATRLGHTVSSCRNSYIDPVLVTPFGKKYGWDERTISEKKTRDDLPVFEKAVTVLHQPGKRGGRWHFNKQGKVTYDRHVTIGRHAPTKAWHGGFDPSVYKKQIDEHRFTENAHRERAKQAHAQIKKLVAQKRAATTAHKKAVVQRKLVKVRGQHADHKAVVSAARKQRLKVTQQLKTAHAKHKAAQRVVANKKRKVQARKQKREAIMTTGFGVIRGEDDIVVAKPKTKAKNKEQNHKEPEPAHHKEPEKREEPAHEPEVKPHGTTSLWQPGDDERLHRKNHGHWRDREQAQRAKDEERKRQSREIERELRERRAAESQHEEPVEAKPEKKRDGGFFSKIGRVFKRKKADDKKYEDVARALIDSHNIFVVR